MSELASELESYAYVTVEDPVAFAPSYRELHARTLAHRYLGPELGDRYFTSTEGSEPALVTLRPERWFSTDDAKL